jgi:hypothetical protein
MNNIYDYAIIGGGPTGLTLAWLFGSNNKKVILLEKESTLGGCHRVHRVNEYFTEHGPRVYSDSYVVFMDLLKDMKLDFYDLFIPCNFNISKINDKNIDSLKLHEKISLLWAFSKLIFNPYYGINIYMKTFMDDNDFSDDTQNYIERICILTNGVSTFNYTLYQFLQLANYKFLNKLYQPKIPNDKGLIKLWTDKLLLTNNVDIFTNTEVINLSDTIIYALSNQKKIEINAKKIIITLPPKPLISLLKQSIGYENAFGPYKNLEKWALQNSYVNYISVTFHYKKKIYLPQLNGFSKTPWGITFIILSNYTDFNNDKSKNVISICITFTDIKNEYGKTANQCSQSEIIDYITNKLSFLPQPDKIIFSPNVVKHDDKWINLDTAFVLTTPNHFLESKSKIYDNLFAVGIYNGKSNYIFTSLESAVQNAISFAKQEIPDLKYKFTTNIPLNLIQIIYNIILLLFLLLILTYIKNYIKLNKKNDT